MGHFLRLRDQHESEWIATEWSGMGFWQRVYGTSGARLGGLGLGVEWG